MLSWLRIFLTFGRELLLHDAEEMLLKVAERWGWQGPWRSSDQAANCEGGVGTEMS
jgi:hypothetical protein